MKRPLILLALLAALSTGIAAQQKQSLADSIRPNWTIGFKAGLTYFNIPSIDAEQKKAGQSCSFGSALSHEFSIFSEYTFVPGVGLGAYLGNYSFNRTGVYGSSIELGFYAHLELLQLFSWNRPPAIARRFHLFWDTGLGGSAVWQINQITGDPSSMAPPGRDTPKPFWRPYAVIRTALQFEFMIKPQWGLFLEGEYHGYGHPRYSNDEYFHSAQWMHTAALSAGFRFYFDDRPKPDDPRLDKNDLPIRKPRPNKTQANETQTNVYYINVDVTPEMLAGAGTKTITDTVYIQTAPETSPIAVPRSPEVESALRVLQEQGEGTVLISSIQFDSEAQLTEESMEILDKVAGSLTSNNQWKKINMLYSSDRQATSRSVVISAYLRAKGVQNLTIKGFEAPTSMPTSDLIITIK